VEGGGGIFDGAEAVDPDFELIFAGTRVTLSSVSSKDTFFGGEALTLLSMDASSLGGTNRCSRSG